MTEGSRPRPDGHDALKSGFEDSSIRGQANRPNPGRRRRLPIPSTRLLGAGYSFAPTRLTPKPEADCLGDMEMA